MTAISPNFRQRQNQSKVFSPLWFPNVLDYDFWPGDRHIVYFNPYVAFRFDGTNWLCTSECCRAI
jgi:hypothetical protein